MSNINDFLKGFDPTIKEIQKLNASGSGRINYKIKSDKGIYIYTKNEDVKENEAFFYLSTLFKNLNGNVPEILHIKNDRTAYIQSYLGDKTLLELKLDEQNTVALYKKIVQQLARLQIGAAQIIEKTKLFDSKNFNAPLVYRDLFYFKNYFLDFTSIAYQQSNLLQEFEKLAQKIAKANYIYVMLRDFQGRNIMINKGIPYFIDYQDAMLGPIAYDLVSLLWQAKAALTTEEKDTYYKVYTEELKKLIPNQFNAIKFEQDYETCLILRLLQVLGAYGKLGLIQQKPHFKKSIKFGIQNLKAINQQKFMAEFPTLQQIIEQLSTDNLPKIVI